MFGREVAFALSRKISQLLKTALVNSSEEAEKNRQYADDKLHTAQSTLKPGDRVLVRKTRVNKLTPTYNPTQLTVMAR